jgi:hypothetical protein
VARLRQQRGARRPTGYLAELSVGLRLRQLTLAIEWLEGLAERIDRLPAE